MERTRRRVGVVEHLWEGYKRDSEIGEHFHPTQKPSALMRWCIGLAGDVATVLDPYMGSGTTLRAAKDLGHRAIGVEVEERYCEIAARRLGQEVLDFGGQTCPTCHDEKVVERLATPEEVDNGCELGVAFDPCPVCVANVIDVATGRPALIE